MSWTRLQMLSLGSLLLFGDRAVCCGDRCYDDQGLQQRRAKIQGKLCYPTASLSMTDDPFTSCEQVAQLVPDHLRTRSISPWRFRLDSEENRIPRDIYKAECLCGGCLINGKESASYNSVEVKKVIKVYKISKCPKDPSKHLIKCESEEVPVACTCVAPKVDLKN